MSDRVDQLCQRAREGDAGAASELVTLFYQRVFVFFRRLCGNEADADDLTQKTFSKVWLSLPSYDGRSSFSTWVHGIGYHVYADWRRKGNRLDARADEWWAAREAEGPSPFEDTAEREMAHRLYSLVEQLEEGSREAVHLHYYQGLSLKETAAILDLATSTVKYRLREALKVLKSKATEPKTRIK